MALSLSEKTRIVESFSQHHQDTGSVEVQVALLTHDIESLNQHIKNNPKDVHSRRGLVNKVRQRESLLNYLFRKDRLRYLQLVKRLSIRDKRSKS